MSFSEAGGGEPEANSKKIPKETKEKEKRESEVLQHTCAVLLCVKNPVIKEV